MKLKPGKTYLNNLGEVIYITDSVDTAWGLVFFDNYVGSYKENGKALVPNDDHYNLIKEYQMKLRAILTMDDGHTVEILANEKSMLRLKREAEAKGWKLSITEQVYSTELNGSLN